LLVLVHQAGMATKLVLSILGSVAGAEGKIERQSRETLPWNPIWREKKSVSFSPADCCQTGKTSSEEEHGGGFGDWVGRANQETAIS